MFSKSKKNLNLNWKLQESIGKYYVFDTCDNYQTFLTELGVRKAIRIKALNSVPTIVLTKMKEYYILTTTYPEGKHVRVKFKDGETFQRRRHGGGSSASLINVVENKLVETQTIGRRTVVTVREFAKEGVHISMEIGSVKCHRFYLPSRSKHSIQTETSRRSSMANLEVIPANPPKLELESLHQAQYDTDGESETDSIVCY